MSKYIIESHGPLITRSNFWQEGATDYYLSVVPGAVRLLVPYGHECDLKFMRQANAVQFSNNWVEPGYGLDLVFVGAQVGTSTLLVTGPNYEISGPDEFGKLDWVFSAWIDRHGHPHKAVERKAFFVVKP